ncbi:hypothetical protein [Niabella soli]|nr:hypothetical protein [Niabella soli]
MRIYLLFTLMVCFATSSCTLSFRKYKKPFAVESASDPQLKKLVGEWMCTKIVVESNNRAQELEMEDVLSSVREDLELNVIELGAPDSAWTSYRSNGNGYQAMQWEFQPANNINFSADGAPVGSFAIAALEKDTMVLLMQLRPPDGGAGKAVCSCQFTRINSRKIAGMRLYDPAINWWRPQPQKNESHTELVNRLKAMLKFDYVYIRSLYYSAATYIDTKRLNMPFIYYNGGIGLKDYPDGTDSFTNFFYSKENIEEAMHILAKGFGKVQYTKRPNYTLEYAQFMKDLADVIE